MKIELVKNNNVDFCVVDDVYEEDEYQQILDELNSIVTSVKLRDSLSSGTATTAINELKSDRKSIFYEDLINSKILLSDRESTKYFKFYNRIIDQLFLLKQQNNLPVSFNFLFNTSSDTSLINVYDKGEKYLPHHDECVFSMIYFLHNEPKKFLGGDLILVDADAKINYKKNRAVLFPSWVNHGVTEVETEENLEIKNRRFSIATFYTCSDKKAKTFVPELF